MPFTSKCFASKIKDLKDGFGNSTENLVDLTGISTERLALLENGEDNPTGGEVLILADYYGCDFEWLIEDEAENSDKNLNLLFRTEGEKLAVSDRHAIKEFLYLCKSQTFVENILQMKPAKSGFQFSPQGPLYKRHGKECAKALRQWYGYPPNAIVPDVYEWFRGIGIRLFRRALPNSPVSGLFINHPYAGKCILINYYEDLYRQRFSAAHEGAHALMDADRPYNVSQEVDQRSTDLKEVRANAFASDFLMPPELLRTYGGVGDWNDPNKVVAIADKLWVSVPALLTALKGAGLLDEENRTKLKAMKLRPPEKREPELISDLSPRQRDRKTYFLSRGLHNAYVHQCFDAYTRALITQGKLAELLLVSIAELPELAALFEVSLRYD